MSIQILCPFLIGLFVFLLLVYLFFNLISQEVIHIHSITKLIQRSIAPSSFLTLHSYSPSATTIFNLISCFFKCFCGTLGLLLGFLGLMNQFTIQTRTLLRVKEDTINNYTSTADVNHTNLGKSGP